MKASCRRPTAAFKTSQTSHQRLFSPQTGSLSWTPSALRHSRLLHHQQPLGLRGL